jgi:hypothetical protein
MANAVSHHRQEIAAAPVGEQRWGTQPHLEVNEHGS